MSVYLRNRRKRYRNIKAQIKSNAGPDRLINKWQLIDIHEINTPIENGDEFDFWCLINKDAYLLRLKKSENERFSITKSTGNDAPIYLVAELNFDVIGNNMIETVLKRFINSPFLKYTRKSFKIYL